MKTRFVDDNRTVYSFAHLFLVECPRCGHCAHVQAVSKMVRRSPPRRCVA